MWINWIELNWIERNCCLHFIQVINPFIIYSHLSFRHVEPRSMAGHISHIQEPSIWPCSPRVSHSSVVRASNLYLEGHGFDSRWGLRNFFSWVFRLDNASSLFTLYLSHQSIYMYHLFTFIISTCWASQYGRTHVAHIKSWVWLPLGAQKILFLSILTWEHFFIIKTLSKSPIHLSD